MSLPIRRDVVTADEVCNALQIGSDKKDILNRASVDVLLKMIYSGSPNIKSVYIMDFINRSLMTKANPFLKQIYLIPKGESAIVVHSYHFFLDKANQTGEFEGITVSCKAEMVFSPHKGEDVKMLVATAIVKRKGRVDFPFPAHWNEFYKPSNPSWASMPYIMLQKCAAANALRYCFPEALSGCYIAEEMDDGKIDPEDPNVFNAEFKAAEEVVKDTKKAVEKTEQYDDRVKAYNYLIEFLSKNCGDMKNDEKFSLLEGTGIINFVEIKNKSLNEILEIQEIIYSNLKKKKPSFSVGG